MAISTARTFVLAFLVGGSASVWAYHELSDNEILVQRIKELEIQQERLEHQISFLKERKRVAQIEVLEQKTDPDAPGGKRSTVRFWEVGSEMQPAGPAQEFTIDGDVLYVDAQVIKFDQEFLQQNDLEEGSSLLLFRRLFGEFQTPHDGYALDQQETVPPIYSAEDAPADAYRTGFHQELWRDFWRYANRPEVIRRSGIHAMHGEAPYIQLVPGGRYEIELRTTGGLSIRALD
ncbi:MAG: hypothetical protein HQ519_10490 [Planctomycetes bacterium]|nr:hypothetical protein [Planctomycetota bacterium]